MRVTICGARGSTPAVGTAFARYGGHSTSVAVAGDDGRPTLLLDAGTGIREVPALLGGEPFVGTILLSHLHWDHVQGLPFCSAADRPDARVRLLLPDDGTGDAEALLARAMSPPFFPIGPEGLRGKWSFGTLDEGQHDVEGWSVTVREVPHKGGRTMGLRVSDGRAALAFLPDHGAHDHGATGAFPDHEAALTLARDADVLLHDAQHTAAEYAAVSHYGHATVDDAVRLACVAGARRLLLFHHDPRRTDDELDEIVAGIDAPLPVAAARQGQVLVLPG